MQEIVNRILGEKEGAVYLATLELGEAPVADIAKKAGIPRSTAYLILDDLKEKGLVSEISKNNRTRIVVEPPEKIMDYLKNKRSTLLSLHESLRESLPQLKALYNQHPQKPAVRFYEGFAGVKTVLQETLAAQEILVLCSGYDTPVERKLSNYLDKYFAEVDKRGIKTYELLGPAPDLNAYVTKYRSDLHQIKTIPNRQPDNRTVEQSNNGRKHIDKLIFANKLALLSFEFLNATVIEHQPLVDFERSLFWPLWRG